MAPKGDHLCHYVHESLSALVSQTSKMFVKRTGLCPFSAKGVAPLHPVRHLEIGLIGLCFPAVACIFFLKQKTALFEKKHGKYFLTVFRLVAGACSRQFEKLNFYVAKVLDLKKK